MLQRISEWHKTTWELIGGILAIILPALGTAAYCAFKVASGEGHEQFRLGFVDIPKYLGAGASYLDILILDGMMVVALVVGFGLRYYHYRDERDFLKKYKIKGETGFTSDLKPSKGSSGFFDDYDD
jgi:hypothetical protein